MVFAPIALYFFDRSDDSILVERSKKNRSEENHAPPTDSYERRGSKISGQSTLIGTSTSSGYNHALNTLGDSGVDKISSVIGAKDAVSNDTKESVDKELVKKQEPAMNWFTIFHRWQMVLIDTLSINTAIKDFTSTEDCGITFVHDSGTTQFNDVSNLVVKMQGYDLLLSDSAGVKLRLKQLKSPMLLSSATEDLVTFCTQKNKNPE